jgi:hypothetical protein
MTTIINGSSPSITFSDSTTQTTAFTTGAVTQATIGTNVAGTGPAFRATKSSVQTISNNTLTKVTFDTETFDTNNNFASSTFTPTVAGYYQVNYSYSALNLTTGRTYTITALLYKSGSSYTQFEQNITSAADQWGSILTALVYCNGSTDYIEAYIYQNNSPAGTINLNGTASTTQFSAVMVRGA